MQAPDGNIYVGDRGRKEVFVFTPEGKFVKKLPGPKKPESKAAFKWAPLAMTFDAKGNLYITDILLQHRVLSYTREDKLRFQFGRKGESPNSKAPDTAERFWFPNGITLDNRGNIWVADSNNRRLQVYDRDGKFGRIFVTGGLPRGIKFYDVGLLMIVDTLGHDVGVWDKKGNNLCYFGERGTDIGQFQYPNDISIGPDKKIYVTDVYNNRVQVWAFAPQIPKPIAKYLPPPWCCLIPLLLLPLLLLLRKKKYLATDDFLELVVDNERLDLLEGKRIIVMEETYARFRHVEQDDLNMAEILETEEWDEADVREYMDQYQVDEYEARILSMTHRKKYLLTEDPDLRRIATALGVETLNYDEFVARFEEHEEEEQ
jgi:sugar lactone lactonase YvrE